MKLLIKLDDSEIERKKKIVTIFNIEPNLDRNRTKLYINLEDRSNDIDNDTDVDPEIQKKLILHIYLTDRNQSQINDEPVKLKRKL